MDRNLVVFKRWSRPFEHDDGPRSFNKSMRGLTMEKCQLARDN